MKRIYIAPTTNVITVMHSFALLAGSMDTDLENFGGSGGESEGAMSADSRRGSFWGDEEE